MLMLIFMIFPHSRAILGHLLLLDESLYILRSKRPCRAFCGLVLKITGVEQGLNRGRIENQ